MSEVEDRVPQDMQRTRYKDIPAPSVVVADIIRTWRSPAFKGSSTGVVREVDLGAPRQRDGTSREAHTWRPEWPSDVEREPERAGVRKPKGAAWGRRQEAWEIQEQLSERVVRVKSKTVG